MFVVEESTLELPLNSWVNFCSAGLLHPLLSTIRVLVLQVQSRYTRARILEKSYICVFICMETKAVHLEVVRNLSVEGFLAALCCFIARRSCPETLATDNGTNFRGAQKELKDLYDLLQAPKTQIAVNRYRTTQHTKWTHTPARSPHFGGLLESAIKSMKLLLAKMVGRLS